MRLADFRALHVLGFRGHGNAASSSVGGLYAVTPDELDTSILARKVEQALRGGARLVQYRNKTAAAAIRREQGRALLRLCRAAKVPLIINDDLQLSIELDADGVHLGRGDGDIASARRALAAGKLLGVSCYDDLGLAKEAQKRGADYVAFGAAYPTSTKPGAVKSGLSIYGEAKSLLQMPVVAIGGITTGNVGAVLAAGADAAAVISALFDAPDIEQRAREFTSVIRRNFVR